MLGNLGGQPPVRAAVQNVTSFFFETVAYGVIGGSPMRAPTDDEYTRVAKPGGFVRA
jgi:hypothetical protein